MRIVIDVEANALYNPDKIWVVVCKDMDTGQIHIFRNLTSNEEELKRFLDFVREVDLFVGHNFLGYDLPVLSNLCGLPLAELAPRSVDTLIVSKLVDYSRKNGHSVEDYGLEFDYPKIKFSDFSKYSKEMEEYCVRDVEITHKIYLKYKRQIEGEVWQDALKMEHQFQLLCNDLQANGFAFNKAKAEKLLEKVTKELAQLDAAILTEFPPKPVVVREFTPRATKFGTISKTSVPRSLWGEIHNYEVGQTYPLTKLVEFNPASHKQIISVLNDAGWQPIDKTTTHIDTERELTRLKRQRNRDQLVDTEIKLLHNKLELLQQTGWRVNETNLNTLPETAPSPARTLARRILLEARRRTLTEWLGLVQDDNRIHGKFYGIGAWTHRMAHQQPNTANIPRETAEDGSPKLLGGEMRALWQAPRNRLLVGVDAEGIQLRIFAHYINDEEFTQSLIKGKKSDKTDPHSLNQRILGDVCRTRQAAKRFIYALLLGGGLGKLSQILGCSQSEAREALDRLIQRYSGFKLLKETQIPKDAKRGYFLGLDQRAVRIPGDTEGERRHLCMSGYLQNGEAVIMKKACLLWHEMLKDEPSMKFVNFVHDEWQTECANDLKVALRIAEVQADSLKIVGEQLGLKCPMAGSYWNDDINDYTIGTNWKVTH